jgi:hypothetical protein
VAQHNPRPEQHRSDEQEHRPAVAHDLYELSERTWLTSDLPSAGMRSLQREQPALGAANALLE